MEVGNNFRFQSSAGQLLLQLEWNFFFQRNIGFNLFGFETID